MTRIDPIKLLHCLSVLLSPNGGIKSRNEVQRLAGLMTKFSKKLVSKCIYIQILKSTETEILGSFMGSGGWLLMYMWLTESIVAKNWPLGKELLELLLLCPVDMERLKSNNCPKLVKELSKDGNHIAIRALASKLVEQWLKTVKGDHVVPIQIADIPHIISNAQADLKIEYRIKEEDCIDKLKYDVNKESDVGVESKPCKSGESITNDSVKIEDDVKKETTEFEEEQEALPVLKITLKDGKQVISQVGDSEIKEELSENEKSKDKHKSKNKEKSSDRSSSSSSRASSKYSSKNSSSSSSSSSSEKHKSSHKSSSSSNRAKDSKQRDKDKHSSHSSKSKNDRRSTDKSNTSSKSKEERSQKSDKEKSKDREKEKDLDKNKQDKLKELSPKVNEKSEDKNQTPSIHKLGKIPKLTDIKKDKLSISIEVRKPEDPKPKTVKTFHSKFRKHGLEEEVKPPPSRATVLSKKVTPVLPPTVAIPKRPSPVHNETPPEKKLKTVETIEKPGSIKLIPPKPKPMLLLESDMFMDALNASATNKKEPKKRKRRTSGSKDGNTPNDNSPPNTPTSVNSPLSENKSVPPRFYQDTLDAEETKEKTTVQANEIEESVDFKAAKNEIDESMDTTEPHTLTINGLKGVLCYHKKKGPKRSIKWKPDSELEEIQYFELDETERVNVTKTFTDMKYLERIHERDAFQKGRNISNDDIMEERTSWRALILLDCNGQILVEYGKNSKEKDIQAIRQKGTLQPLYFHKAMIPDSPVEPDLETHTYSEPTVIPLDDITGNQDNISDFRNMPWPEPKGNAPPTSNNISMPTMFPPNMPQFPNGFPNQQFPVPGFQGPPNMVPPDWQNGVPPHIVMANGMPGPMNPTQLNPGVIPPGNVPPGIMLPNENMMMGPPEMFGGPNPMFPVPPDGFNMQQNMFPMDFNMAQGPGPDGFSGPGNFRGTMRGARGAGGHWRGKNGGNWEGGPQRGRGAHTRGGGRKAVCMYFQRKGSCRQGDNCSFLHPGVNCPY